MRGARCDSMIGDGSPSPVPGGRLARHPRHAPMRVVETLQKAIATALDAPSVRSRMELIAVPRHTTAAEFKSIIASDVAKWTKVAADAGIKVEQ